MGVIAKYKFNQNTYANFIPEFNSEFTDYTITDETDTDGYTIRTIESDSLPTLIRFGSNDSSGEGDYTKQSSLLEVNNLNTINVTDMSLMFYRCANLTYINTNFDTSQVTDMYAMFSTCPSLTSLDLSNFDTSNVTTMYSIFRDCSSLTSLDVSNFNTSKVDSMYCMFNNCSSLISLDLSNFDTSKVTNMYHMFSNCSSLTSLDLFNFNTSNVATMGSMFHSCSSLTSLDLSNFNTGNVTNMAYMFSYCSYLTSLDVSNFNISNVTNIEGMFANCFKITDIGMIYCNSSTINTISSLITTDTTIWYQDAKLSELTVLDNVTYKEYRCVEVQQDVDSIPLTSDMFEQGNINAGDKSVTVGMSYQQFPQSGTNTDRIKSKTIIPVEPNAKYTINFQGYAIMFDRNGGYVKGGIQPTLDFTSGIEFTIPSNVHYIALCVKNSDDSTITPSSLDSMNLILQEVPQEIVLRGIGDVKDELDLTRGEYIQRIKEFVLNGSENWSECTEQHGENTMLFQYREVGCSAISNYTTDGFMCSQLKSVVAAQQWINDEQCISLNVSNAIGIRISKTNATNKNEFLSWLQKEPITIQCRLNVPIIHKVNLTNTKVIPSYATETHYETITPSDSLIPNITIPSTLNYDVVIKPSTEYTIRANTSDNLTVDLGGATGTLSNGKVTLTTPATLTHNEVKFSGTGKVKELMVVEGNEIKDNVPFFNGMKDVQMGGIKLVNIARYKSHANGVSVNTNKTTITFDDNGGVGTTSWGVCQFYDELLKPNTMYTIFMNVTKNTSTNEVPVKIQLGNASERFTNVNRGFTGKFKEKIVTSNDISEQTLALFFRHGQANEQVVIQNPMIIEGDWTHLDEIPFIESEMIIEQPIIRSQGKNLFDINSEKELSCFYDARLNGDRREHTGVDTYTIKIKPNTTYTLSCNGASMSHLTYWDASMSYVGAEVDYADTNLRSITTPNRANYVKFPIHKEGITNIQLELGTTATSYEPYKHQTLYSNRVIGYEEGCWYSAGDGAKQINQNLVSLMADVEGLQYAYVHNTSSHYSFWDKDGVFISGLPTLPTALGLTDKNGFLPIPSNAKYMKCACGLYEYGTATVTGDLPLRSLPNGVCDTLNLVTGEYVQRVGEVVLDGSDDEGWNLYEYSIGGAKYFRIEIPAMKSQDNLYIVCTHAICDKLEIVPYYTGIYNMSSRPDSVIAFAISSALNSQAMFVYQTGNQGDLAQFKQWLQSNPITVQYELAEPIVRKLGFTTKGNYAETALNLNGWVYSDTLDKTIRFKTDSSIHDIVNTSPIITNDYHVRKYGLDAHGDYEYIINIGKTQYINVKQNKLNSLDVNGFVQWLQHNPIEVEYISSTQSSESYSNIHKPIFFNDVNVQFLPQNLDIQPELTFQARTRNSYVMDMMKPNVTYTMKVSNYDANTRIWMANTNANTSVMSNKTFQFADITLNDSQKQLIIVGNWYEPMIIEGNLTGKNLPYFKGILSAYHDVDEIEIYSENKNLFDMGKVKPYDYNGTHWWNTIVKENEVVSVRSGTIENGQFGAYIKIDVRPNSVYTLYMEMEKDGEPYGGIIYAYENDDLWGNTTFIGYANSIQHLQTSQNAKYVTIGINYGVSLPIGTTLVSKNMRLYLGEESPTYIPHAHNTTLIEMPTRLETVKVVRPNMINGTYDGDEFITSATLAKCTDRVIPVKPGMILIPYNNNSSRVFNYVFYDLSKHHVKTYTHNHNGFNGSQCVVPDNAYYVGMFCGISNTDNISIVCKEYKPIQLNSLPNGVCDEIIMKPNSNKAQLVQRVGKGILCGNLTQGIKPNTRPYAYLLLEDKFSRTMNGDANSIISIAQVINQADGTHNKEHISNNLGYDFGKREIAYFPHSTVTTYEEMQRYTQENPITVYYELATPIIHEIQLKGYPHVYENGTVTLNTDTPHQTLVSYNVNQEQLINNQNETIIRHDKQIDDLYYYIELYLEEIYQMELFRMKLELSL